jgi:hypothetical protein
MVCHSRLVAGTLRTLQRRHRARQLAGDRRAGSWPAGEARRLQYRFVRRQWRRLTLATATMLAVTPGVLLLPSAGRQFFAGAWLALVASLVVYWVTIASGSATRLMGQVGEQWTAAELRELARHGWKIVHHVFVGPHELDHVAVGPGGILVLDSKWTAWRRALPADAGEFALAAQRIAERADMLARTLRHLTGKCAVHSAVVVWGPDVTIEHAGDAGGLERRPVLAGEQLRDWLADVMQPSPDAAVDAARVERAWEHLEREAVRADARDRRSGRHPASIVDVATQLWWGVVGGFAGVIAVGTVWGHLDAIAALPASGILAVAGVAGRRSRAMRTAATGWLAGIAGTMVIVAALTAAVLVVD